VIYWLSPLRLRAFSPHFPFLLHTPFSLRRTAANFPPLTQKQAGAPPAIPKLFPPLPSIVIFFPFFFFWTNSATQGQSTPSFHSGRQAFNPPKESGLHPPSPYSSYRNLPPTKADVPLLNQGILFPSPVDAESVATFPPPESKKAESFSSLYKNHSFPLRPTTPSRKNSFSLSLAGRRREEPLPQEGRCLPPLPGASKISPSLPIPLFSPHARLSFFFLKG